MKHIVSSYDEVHHGAELYCLYILGIDLILKRDLEMTACYLICDLYL